MHASHEALPMYLLADEAEHVEGLKAPSTY